MVEPSDVHPIALALPGLIGEEGRFAFSVQKGGMAKAIAWEWLERVDPGKARLPNPEGLPVRVANGAGKDLLLAAAPDRFFTEPHSNGFPAVLVRLAAIEVDELEGLIIDAWRARLRGPTSWPSTHDRAAVDAHGPERSLI